MIVTDKVGRTWREELERVRGFIGCRIVREEWEIPKEGRDPPPPQHRGRRGALPECGTHPIRPMATPHGGHGRARAAVGRGGGVPAFAGNQTTGGIDTVGQRSPDQYGEAVLSELALRTPRSQRGGGAWHCEKGFSRVCTIVRTEGVGWGDMWRRPMSHGGRAENSQKLRRMLGQR